METLDQLIDDSDFEELIEALALHLSETWDEEAESVLEQLEAVAESQEASIFGDLLTGILSAASILLGRRFAQRVRGAVDQTRRLTYELSMERYGVRFVESGNVIDERVLQWLDEYDQYWLRTHYDKDVRGRLTKAAGEIQTENLGRAEAAKFLQDRMRGVLKGEGSRNYFELVSAAVNVRSRSLASIQAYERLGYSAYEIVAVLDRKTNEVCRHLDGMRFEVGDAVAWRERLMGVDQATQDWPERVKEISPWPRYEQIRSINDPSQLAQMGIIAPPFHGHCRTTIAPVL